MPTPSGTIKASDIRSEFGATSGKSVSLGAYRVSQSVSGLSNLPLDAGVPQSGAISFGNLRGKKLNIVVDCTAPSGEWKTSVNGRQEYNSGNNITVIGGFTTKPNSPAGKKVWIHTNGNIGGGVYLSRGSKGVTCTYPVIVGYNEPRPLYNEDGNPVYDQDGNLISIQDPIYDNTTQTYGQLHFYAEYSELRTTDYSLENRYAIRLFRRQEPGTTLLYRLYNGNTLDHLYSLDPNEGTGSGYNLEGPIGYVYASDGPNRTPVWRLYCVYGPPDGNCPTIIDRLLTTDPNERPGGYTVDNNGNPFFWAPSFVNGNPSSINSCSLLTGSWDDTTDLIVDIGSSGAVYGAGGDGGKGADVYQPNGGSQITGATNGGSGTSALGIILTNNTIINNRGSIVNGGGGGGGGGGAAARRKRRGKDDNTACGGGGGGGGRGYPGGLAGKGGVATHVENGDTYSGQDGGGGSLTSGGNGGAGYYSGRGGSASAGGGGGGVSGGLGGDATELIYGDPIYDEDGNIIEYPVYDTGGRRGSNASSSIGGNGGTGSGSNGSSGGANGGPNGYAIVVNGSIPNITGNGTITGDKLPNTNPA